MTDYDQHVRTELRAWQTRMRRRPGLLDQLTRGVQGRVNRVIPEKVHVAITATIKAMVRGVLFGAEVTATPTSLGPTTLVAREMVVQERIAHYRTLAMAEGAATGAAGFLLGLTDFPLLLGFKLKLLFEIAALYGYDVRQYPERVYLLLVFQLAFSSQHGRNVIFRQLEDWDSTAAALPADVHDFDWRTFQQEYRDYIDLAKLAQLLPVIGAAVGAVANYRLVGHLGQTAMMAYRLRTVW
ncbi:MAG: EcsC family protein [Hymenobacteraceae bacterium]|nr:EcsC family protein [Hymenobacteraceae bacterium]